MFKGFSDTSEWNKEKAEALRSLSIDINHLCMSSIAFVSPGSARQVQPKLEKTLRCEAYYQCLLVLYVHLLLLSLAYDCRLLELVGKARRDTDETGLINFCGNMAIVEKP